MNSNKLVLVTGGCGFIGRNLIPQLLNHGYAVRVLDNMSVGSRNDIGEYDVEIIEGDVRNRGTVNHAMPGVFAVVHLAAQTNVIKSQQVPYDDYHTNVGGTLNLLIEARDMKVERFIFASSNAPIGENTPPIDESKPARPLSPYGASKLAGEGYCSAFYGSYGLGTVVLRFANVYGSRSGHKGSVVAKFLKDAALTGTLTIYGDGKQTRDFIHVDDLCRAILASIGKNVNGETFQIATGIETSINHLADLVVSTFPSEVLVKKTPPRDGEIIKNFSDITKAKLLLDWTPTVQLDEGYQETLNWFVSNRIGLSDKTEQ